MKEIGEIILGNKVRISDPYFNVNVVYAVTIEDMLPGKYKCIVDITEDGIVSRVLINHRSVNPDTIPFRYISSSLNVNSGYCGIFDFDYFTGKFQTDWYGRTGEFKYSATLGKKALVSKSGNGNGHYGGYISYDDNGRAVAIEINYGIDES